MIENAIVFALSSSVELAQEIVEYLGLPMGKISVKHFADGEIMVEPEETVRGRSVYIVQSTCSPVSDRLMEVLIAIDACKRASSGEITVIMPYYGYARQDRKAGCGSASDRWGEPCRDDRSACDPDSGLLQYSN